MHRQWANYFHWASPPGPTFLHSGQHECEHGPCVSVCFLWLCYKQPRPQKGSSQGCVCLSCPGYCTRSVHCGHSGHTTVTGLITSRWKSSGEKHILKETDATVSWNQRDPVWTNLDLPLRTKEVSLVGRLREDGNGRVLEAGAQPWKAKCGQLYRPWLCYYLLYI